jgi:ABC-type branched-subunit amino acid transport system substrate-binding protein
MSTLGTGIIIPPQPPRPLWRRRPRTTLALLVVLLLIAGGLYAALRSTTPSTGCGPGLNERGTPAQCVGVSDGSTDFAPQLHTVEQKILVENRKSLASGDYVSVAYFLPMTLGAADTVTIDAVREELEGAYTAQWRADNDTTLGTRPHIRLLLANSGSRSGQEAPVVDQLVAMTTSSDHLVAVLGFGQSLTSTRAAVVALDKARIPMIGATVTADDFTAPDTAPDFFRVGPDNSDEGSAAAHYLQRHFGTGKVMIVYDTNRDDLYSSSLKAGFDSAATAVKLGLTDQPESFLSSVNGTGSAFPFMNDDICVARPVAVFFAGRGRDLGDFVTSLASRQCRSKGVISVVSGDDGSNTVQSTTFKAALANGGVKVYFTGLGHPQEWEGNAAFATEQDAYKTFASEFNDQFSSTAGLQDGASIMGYDAMLTAVEGIHAAAGPKADIPVNTENMLQGLLALQASHSVPGASGPIDLTATGNPRNKPMALIQMMPDGSFAFGQDVIWPLGAPTP